MIDGASLDLTCSLELKTDCCIGFFKTISVKKNIPSVKALFSCILQIIQMRVIPFATLNQTYIRPDHSVSDEIYSDVGVTQQRQLFYAMDCNITLP